MVNTDIHLITILLSKSALPRNFINPQNDTKRVWLGQEKSAQNTATAKTHFYVFRNITEGCQIIFITTKSLSKMLIETKGCFGVLQQSWCINILHAIF